MMVYKYIKLHKYRIEDIIKALFNLIFKNRDYVNHIIYTFFFWENL